MYQWQNLQDAVRSLVQFCFARDLILNAYEHTHIDRICY